MDSSTSFSSCLWRGCGVLVLLGAVGAILLFAEWRAQLAERDARAPVVVVLKEAMAICSLSPNGQFLFIGSPSGVQFYDLAQQQQLDLPLETIMSGPGGSFWLPDNRYFRFHTWREEYDAEGRVRIPTDGHLIDVPNRLITDTLALPMTERDMFLKLAAERELITSRELRPFTAPDGQFKFWHFFIVLRRFLTVAVQVMIPRLC